MVTKNNYQGKNNTNIETFHVISKLFAVWEPFFLFYVATSP